MKTWKLYFTQAGLVIGQVKTKPVLGVFNNNQQHWVFIGSNIKFDHYQPYWTTLSLEPFFLTNQTEIGAKSRACLQWLT